MSNETKPRTCATCGRTEKETRFGASDKYHCLECIAGRIRAWRKRKKEERAEAARVAESAAAVTPEEEPARAEARPVRRAELALTIERHLVTSGEGWVTLAARAGVRPAEVHAILTGAGPDAIEAGIAGKLQAAL